MARPTIVLCTLFACTTEEPREEQFDAVCAQQPGGCAGQGGNLGVPQCLPHEQPCAGACFDLQTSALNCGFCGTACAPGDVCQAGFCSDVCGGELGSCGGACVNLARDANHCGNCGQVCAPGQFCDAGICSATCLGTLCQGATGSECAMLASDRNHCGTCNNPCPQGDICVDSRCVLDCGALTDCNRSCVDLQTDASHCGMCGMACPAAKSCMQGVCSCSQDLTECGDECIDTETDAANCGECGNACAEGDRCEAGRCVGPDGCVDTPAVGISLSEVAVYQAVKIAIMEDGAAVDASDRNADVVQGRDAVFRVHVEPGSGWTPREISARLQLTDDAEQATGELFFAKITPTEASRDMDPDSTFQIKVPAEALTENAQYAVSLVECDAEPPTGMAQGARFPSDGYSELQARETGPIRIHLLPIDSGGGTADLSEEALETYRARLYAMYPVTAVEITVGEPLASFAGSMCDHLGAVGSRRSADDAPVDLYYYGVTTGISGGQSGCSGAPQSASSSGKSSAGWANDRGSLEGGAATMSHELGHAQGRLHAPCQVQDPDPSYPYPNADIGVWALDMRSDEFLPPSSKDMMSYCPNPVRSEAWLSDYTYQALIERVADVNALASRTRIVPSAEPKVAWRMLIADSTGVRWGQYPLFVRGTPEGEPLSAVVHDRQGPMQSVQVYKQDLEDGISHHAFMLIVPEPPNPDWHALEVPTLLAPLLF